MWVRYFLAQRPQIIGHGERPLLYPRLVTSEVSQESVIRPILFLVYTNVLPNKLFLEVELFAEDTVFFNTSDD